MIIIVYTNLAKDLASQLRSSPTLCILRFTKINAANFQLFKCSVKTNSAKFEVFRILFCKYFFYINFFFELISTQCYDYIETCHLICPANQ